MQVNDLLTLANITTHSLMTLPGVSPVTKTGDAKEQPHQKRWPRHPSVGMSGPQFAPARPVILGTTGRGVERRGISAPIIDA
jgi:hypothetical protein